MSPDTCRVDAQEVMLRCVALLLNLAASAWFSRFVNVNCAFSHQCFYLVDFKEGSRGLQAQWGIKCFLLNFTYTLTECVAVGSIWAENKPWVTILWHGAPWTCLCLFQVRGQKRKSLVMSCKVWAGNTMKGYFNVNTLIKCERKARLVFQVFLHPVWATGWKNDDDRLDFHMKTKKNQ